MDHHYISPKTPIIIYGHDLPTLTSIRYLLFHSFLLSSSLHDEKRFRTIMSSSTTKKFREFMAEPLGDKGIRDVPGIGDVLGAKLSEAGYEKVR